MGGILIRGNSLLPLWRSRGEDTSLRSAETAQGGEVLDRIMQVLMSGFCSSHIFICGVAGIISFSPIIIYPSRAEHSPLIASFDFGNQFRTSSLTLLILLIPLVLDKCISHLCILGLWSRRKQLPKIVPFSGVFSSMEYILLIAGFAIVPIIGFISAKNDGEHDIRALTCLCAKSCQTIFVLGSIASSLSRRNPKYWQGPWTSIALLCLSINQTLPTFSTEREQNPTVQTSYIVTGTLGVIVFYVMSIRWAYLTVWVKNSIRNSADLSTSMQDPVRPLSSVSTNKGPANDDPSYLRTGYVDHVFQYSCTLGQLAIASVVIIAAAISGCGPSNFEDPIMMGNNIAMIMAELILLVLVLLEAKAQVIRLLGAVVQARKSYVRFISHELRTPLNVACLGLKMLTDQLGHIDGVNNPRVKECHENACDVNRCVQTAVEILNSLLCFDKIDNNIMELRKQKVPVMHFLSNCVKTFLPQARERGVSLNIVTNPVQSVLRSGSGCLISPSISQNFPGNMSNKLLASAEAVLDTDEIFVDLFKMNQVLGNIISNALKACPSVQNGIVEVSAGFVAGINGAKGKSVKPIVETSAKNAPELPNRPLSLHVERSADEECWFKNDCRPPDAAVKHTNSVKVLRSSLTALRKRLSSSVLPDDDQSRPPKNYVNGVLQIIVSDNGLGISKVNQKRLFSDVMQFNTDELHASGGAGLGLLIAKGIIDLHDGKISVHSRGEGRGSTFMIEVPMKRKIFASPVAKLSPRIDLAPHRGSRADYVHSDRLNLNCFVDEQVRVASSTPLNDPNEGRDAASKVPLACQAPKRPRRRIPGVASMPITANTTTGSVRADVSPFSMSLKPIHENFSSLQMSAGDLERYINSHHRIGDKILVPSHGSDNERDEKDYDCSTGYGHCDRSPSICFSSSERPYIESSMQRRIAISRRCSFETTQPIVCSSTSVLEEQSNGKESGLVKPSKGETKARKLMSLLVVDDCKLSRKMMIKTLTADGHTVDEADDGDVAVDKVKGKMDGNGPANVSYDAILMDFMMPNMDGPTATRQIRELGYTAPIFGVTGNVVDYDVRHFKESGANEVFPKPFNLEKFYKAMG